MEVFGPPTITPAKFAEVLAGSPVLQERPAQEYYDAIVGYGLDPAFMLAVFKHESDCGRNPQAVVNRYGTKNWGNTRSLSLEGGIAVPVNTDRGQFVKFSSWSTGLHDACYRLVSPAYPYAKAKARQVETIIPIWAPSGDLDNKPAAYIASVLTNMLAWREEVPQVGLTMREAIIPEKNPNRPKLPMTPVFITVHETANTSKGANAEMHRKFLVNGGGKEGVSFHWCVDDKEAVHLVPDDEVAWHAGDGTNGNGNRKSIAIETCVNSDGDFGKAVFNLAQLIALLMKRHNIPLANVVQHNHWSGKDCPTTLRKGDAWARVKATIGTIPSSAVTPLVSQSTRPLGWLNTTDADVFRWDGEGIIVERWSRWYNPEKKKFYHRRWSIDQGYEDFVEE